MFNTTNTIILSSLLCIASCAENASSTEIPASDTAQELLGIQDYLVLADEGGVSVSAINNAGEQIAVLSRALDGSFLVLHASSHVLELEAETQALTIYIDGDDSPHHDFGLLEFAGTILADPGLAGHWETPLEGWSQRQVGPDCLDLELACHMGHSWDDCSRWLACQWGGPQY